MFPTRYLGAKSWSIPGVMIRTPIILFKRIFYQEPITKGQFFGSGYHDGPIPEMTSEQTKEVLRYGAYGLVPFKYEENKWANPFDGKIVEPNDLGIDLTKIPGNVQIKNKSFFDKTNLFKAVIIEDENELVVAFGAMHSHWHDFDEQWDEAKKMTFQPLKPISLNYFGLDPSFLSPSRCHRRAAQEVAEMKNKTLVVTGQSLAGSLASYASLKHR